MRAIENAKTHRKYFRLVQNINYNFNVDWYLKKKV